MQSAATKRLVRIGRIGGRVLPWMLALLVLVLAVALFVAGRADERPRAAVGDVFGTEAAEDPLHDTGEVLIPWARLDVGVSVPTDELPELRGAPSNLAAPEDGSFVRVQARVDELIPTFVTRQPYVTQVDLVLHADGRDYPVSTPGNLDFDPNGTDTRGGDRWVAVKGHPEDLEVRVTVNGQTQTVDADGNVDAGRAARLRENPTLDEIREVDKVDCGTFRTRGDAGLSVAYPKMVKCSITLAARTPYVDGLGWAEPGREFLVAQFEPPTRVDVDTGRVEQRYFIRSKESYAATLDGKAPVHGPIRMDQLSAGVFGYVGNGIQFVFDVPEDQPTAGLRLTLDKRLRLGGPFVNDKQRLKVQWHIPGRKLA